MNHVPGECKCTMPLTGHQAWHEGCTSAMRKWETHAAQYVAALVCHVRCAAVSAANPKQLLASQLAAVLLD